MDLEKFEKERQRIIKVQTEALAAQGHLSQQSLENLQIDKISPLDPEIISRQATQNIGTIGHVAHGKSTLVRAVSGVNVSDHKDVFLHSLFVIDCKTSKRKNQKHHHQVGLCQCKALQVSCLPSSSMLPIVRIQTS